MLAGIASALAVPKLFPGLSPLAGFAPIFVVSILASIVGSLLSDPEPDEVLARFYRQVRPWGFWGPVLRKVRAAEPSFRGNRNAPRDAMNVGLGIAAQMTLVTMPLYMILRDWKGFWISLLVLAVTSAILKKTWLDKLEAA
jgi:Na+/proline symporter